MAGKDTVTIKTNPADFSVLLSAIFTVSREMGLNMERTARAPIYFSAHDFTTAILNVDCEIVALAEYIPVLNGATPFATRAVRDYFKNEIEEGDVFLVNDPYTLDGGNQMADWTIVYPVFCEEEHMFWIANKVADQWADDLQRDVMVSGDRGSGRDLSAAVGKVGMGDRFGRTREMAGWLRGG